MWLPHQDSKGVLVSASSKGVKCTRQGLWITPAGGGCANASSSQTAPTGLILDACSLVLRLVRWTKPVIGWWEG